MATPYLAEVKIVSFNFAPKGYALCNGQILPINQNPALFSLLGTTYGGDGTTNFALPNLQGRTPVHMGNGIVQGEHAGEETHTLTALETPAHTHPLNVVSSGGNKSVPAGNLPATAPLGLGNVFGPAQDLTAMSPAAVSNLGGSQPHENRQPFLTLNFVIALQGIFPSRN